MPDAELPQVFQRVRRGADDSTDPLPGPDGERAGQESWIPVQNGLREILHQVW